MKCIRSYSTDPFFNLAAEEYLVKEFPGECYFQYINGRSVVVGKHQNAMAEVDIDYLNRQGITLARRISGGGAVYHDPGNVNFAFITNEASGDLIKFRKYTAPVIAALKEFGIEARLGKRNEILSGKWKISGTASHVHRTRVLHHGTLLYDSELEELGKCLYANREHYSGKAVRSIRSEVANIRRLSGSEKTVSVFADFLFAYLLNASRDNLAYTLSYEDVNRIDELRLQKYAKWEWNFGYSPRYTVERTLTAKEGNLVVRTSVCKGQIEHIELEGKQDPAWHEWLSKLVGAKHEPGEVERIVKEVSGGKSEGTGLTGALF